MKILITGGTSGIGLALARTLAFRRHQVIACCHTEKEVLLRKEMENENLHFRKLDLKKDEDFAILDEFPFDCIVNQAGICIGGKLMDRIKDGSLEENFRVNVFGTMQFTRLFIQKCREEGRKGKVLLTSSLIGYLPVPYLGCYASTKAVLSFLFQIWHYELMLERVPVSMKLIEPGAYHTGFNQIMTNEIENEEVQHFYHGTFSWLEKRRLNSIVNKMVKAIEEDSARFLYRAPFSQALFTRLYRIFSK